MSVKKGVKLNNENSSVAVPQGAAISEAFQKNADEAMERLQDYKKRSWDNGIKFKSLMESKVLPENKTTILKDLENETLQDLAKLASDINSDIDQPDGMGSVALCQLMMKMLLLQKDNANILQFRIEELEKKLGAK